MSCERHREAVLDAALGGDPSPTLEAHLPSCPACRALLDSERLRLARIDDELRQALAVEPSAWLLPRVRERASREATSAGPWRAAWLLPAAASVVALAVLLPLARRTAPPPLERPRVGSTPTVVASAPPSSLAEPPAPAGGRARPEPRRPSASEPEVLVPPGHEAALRRFVEGVRGLELGREILLGMGLAEPALGEARVDPPWPVAVERLHETEDVRTGPPALEPALSID